MALGVAGCVAGGDDGAPLHADFSAQFEQPATGPTSCPVVAIRFTDESIGGPTRWRWTFGDGSTSDLRHPTWEPGAVVAEVTLTVSRGDDEDSITRMVSTHEC
ncbi:MAG: PKD domain-containing protein [Acidimicrobiales bacterium]